MALIDIVKNICDRLSDKGWGELMSHHGLNINQPSTDALSAELAKIIDVDRSIPGFEDFSKSTARGIEPGNPSESLLYHALASPNVSLIPNQGPIQDFPTLKELDDIENYVFGATPPTLENLRVQAQELLDVQDGSDLELAVVVFAVEYRPAPETPHHKFADLCFSRTGVARVGTMAPHYDGEARGFLVAVPGDANHAIHALPARYAPYIAVKTQGRLNRFGPMRFRDRPSQTGIAEDDKLQFWVPLHKIFHGPECIQGITLQVDLTHHHVNQKLARLHRMLKERNLSNRSEAELQKPPFTFSNNIALWGENDKFGPGVLAPKAQRLVETAELEDEPLAFNVPNMRTSGFADAFSPTLSLDAPARFVRPWPEYAHVRHELKNGEIHDKNDLAAIKSEVALGNYDALHYIDFTGDGWIGAEVPQLSNLDSLKAYSLVTAPDFYPNVDQREVFEWWRGKMQPEIRDSLPPWERALVENQSWQDIWRGGAEPEPLSDLRFGPNPNLTDADFDNEEITISSIITRLQQIDLDREDTTAPATRRHAHLPDAAAGIFAPGWDVSGDWRIPNRTDTIHFASYGLGSPFPEDAKLCAALSTFWPAAAPDTTRTFFEVPFSEGTVCPMTDEELGVGAGGVAWDGIPGPQVVQSDSDRLEVEYSSYDHADYTQNALDNHFSVALTSRVDIDEYKRRIIAMQRSYRAMGIMADSQKNTLHLFSFRQMEFTDAELIDAQQRSNTSLNGPVFRFQFFQDQVRLSSGAFEDNWNQLPLGPEVDKMRFAIRFTWTLFVGTNQFVISRWQQGDGSQRFGNWQQIDA